MPARRDSTPPPALRPSLAWFARPSTAVAVDLLGCTLVRILPDGVRLSGRIVETEAYTGVEDRAAHSFGGRRTPRNEAMYASAGTAYVYFTYGMHFCFNVVCGEINEPVAVLIRALEPLDGIEHMRRRRAVSRSRDTARAAFRSAAIRDSQLCSGPAKLCQALGIDRAFNGVNLLTDPHLFIQLPHTQVPVSSISNTPRIGIDYAQDWTHKPLRWLIADSEHVSRAPPPPPPPTLKK